MPMVCVMLILTEEATTSGGANDSRGVAKLVVRIMV
jgi:hypothetical protein